MGTSLISKLIIRVTIFQTSIINFNVNLSHVTVGLNEHTNTKLLSVRHKKTYSDCFNFIKESDSEEGEPDEVVEKPSPPVEKRQPSPVEDLRTEEEKKQDLVRKFLVVKIYLVLSI